MKNNLTWVETPTGGSAPALVIDRKTFEKVQKFIAQSRREFHHNPTKCVIPEFDHAQTVPLVIERTNFGYDSLLVAIASVLSGWHFIRRHFQPTLYRANSVGLRLIAKHGSPAKAYASQ
jgi:hypothetical protein